MGKTNVIRALAILGLASSPAASVLNTVNLATQQGSLIYQLTLEGPSGGGMPTFGQGLSPEQETLLLKWISAGAPNN